MNSFLFAILIIIPILLIIFGCVFIYNIGPISNLYKSCLSDKEFNVLMNIIFNDPNIRIDRTYITSGKYLIYYYNFKSFHINDVTDFSFWQKLECMYRAEAYLNNIELTRKNLKTKELLKDIKPILYTEKVKDILKD